MNNPISIDGIGAEYMTFICNEDESAVGKVCMMDKDDSVKVCDADKPFFGVIRAIRNGYASVQVSGCFELTYTSTAPTLGINSLVGVNSGAAVTSKDGGVQVLVLHTNTVDKTVGFKLYGGIFSVSGGAE